MVLFSRFNRLNQSPGFSQESIRLGIVQVMFLDAPFMRDEERLHLNNLSQAYLR